MAAKTKSSALVLPRGVAGTEPSSAEAGTLSFDDTTDTLRIKLSSGWADLDTGGGSALEWDPTSRLHYYPITSSYGTAGTQVATLTDAGTSPKHLTQATAGLRPTVGYDGASPYVVGNGTTQYLEAATASDWRFLDGPDPFSIGCVVSRAALASTNEFLFSTSWTGDTHGSALIWSFTAATNGGQGPSFSMGGGTKHKAEYPRGSTARSVIVIRHRGGHGTAANSTSGIQTIHDCEMWVDGQLVSTSAVLARTDSGFYGTGTRTLTLFARRDAVGAINLPSALRLFDLWMDSTCINDRKLDAYHAYCASTWGTPS